MAKNGTAKYWTEAEICKRLASVFPSPAHVVLPQVRNGTGFARRQTRTADAVVCSLYPSRGLWLAGIEIKVLLHDWKRELADADKSAEIQQFCKYWYVAAPEGLIPKNELPETWGLIECTARNANIAVKAPELPAKPPDMLLICSILRAVADTHVHADAVQEQVEAMAKQFAKDRDDKLKYLEEDIEAFTDASGIDLKSERWRNKEIGKAAKMVLDSGLLNGTARLEKLKQEANRIAADCETLLAAVGNV